MWMAEEDYEYKPFVGGPVGKLAAVLRRAVIGDDKDTGSFCPLASSSVPRMQS